MVNTFYPRLLMEIKYNQFIGLWGNGSQDLMILELMRKLRGSRLTICCLMMSATIVSSLITSEATGPWRRAWGWMRGGRRGVGGGWRGWRGRWGREGWWWGQEQEYRPAGQGGEVCSLSYTCSRTRWGSPGDRQSGWSQSYTGCQSDKTCST